MPRRHRRFVTNLNSFLHKLGTAGVLTKSENSIQKSRQRLLVSGRVTSKGIRPKRSTYARGPSRAAKVRDCGARLHVQAGSEGVQGVKRGIALQEKKLFQAGRTQRLRFRSRHRDRQQFDGSMVREREPGFIGITVAVFLGRCESTGGSPEMSRRLRTASPMASAAASIRSVCLLTSWSRIARLSISFNNCSACSRRADSSDMS